MKHKKSFLIMLLILGLLFATTGASRVAIRAPVRSLADVFSISWWTVDNGGGASQAGPYQIQGTAGQMDTGYSAGGPYKLRGGFWSGLFYYAIHLPIISRGVSH
ncbi:MAG: hypothetical protein ACM3H7_01510 [Acidobacteriaceae bacterium]